MATDRFAWVLNLDADLELAMGPGYTPRRSVREAMRTFAPVLAGTLLAPGDIVIDESSQPGCALGFVGRAFCPTPHARALLAKACATATPHPPVEVLRRVNSRAFCAEFFPHLPEASFVLGLERVRVKLATAPPPFSLGGAWRVKSAFGMSGRGQRVVSPRTIGDADLAFIRSLLEQGGVQIEPNVAIVQEYGLHGMLSRAGAPLELGAVVEQRCDARGAWLSTARASAPNDVVSRLTEQAKQVAFALFREGYFGPFGVDAYTYRDELADIHFHPSSEVNARYSMGFGIGFARAPDAA